ncbi:MAG: nuclear transport factor 2 family protein [Candidatus Eisenbacteria bacterium]|nr:nuclear transport factor 2 family protein [Candidatus Eisenbacteria bacterium]
MTRFEGTAAEVWRVVRALNDSWTKSDGSGLTRYFHPRMTAIALGVRGRYVGQEDCVAAWKAFAGYVTVHSWEEMDPRVEVFGDTAVVTYEYEMSVTRRGQQETLRGRDMMTLVREDGRWWVVGDHFSGLPGG